MRCSTLDLEDGTIAVICGGRRKPPQCHYCVNDSEYECDFPIGRKNLLGERRTCGRHLCAYHREKGITKDVDFCREHYPMAKAAWEKKRLKQATDLLYKPLVEGVDSRDAN